MALQNLPIKRIGVIAVAVHQGKLLVIERSLTVQAPGAFCFPGGGMEPGETQQETIVREMQEELGVDVEPVQKLWENITAWQVKLHWWEVSLREPEYLYPNPEEVADAFWLPPDGVRSLPVLLTSNHDFLDAWADGVFCVNGASPPGNSRPGN
jgi:8-oxo-dGTP diphosphatase